MNSTIDALIETIKDEPPVDPEKIFGPKRDSLYIVIPITVIYCIIFVTGILGNIFTCLVIARNKSMHTATNYYLFSLAISDLLLLVTGIPQEIYSIWSKWPYIFGNAFCIIRGLASETSTNASVLTITLFTVERYLAICHPFVSHKMSKLSRATKHVVWLWLVSLWLAMPQALQLGVRKVRSVIMCLQTRVIIEHSFEISTFVFFFAPMVLISVLYALIGLKLREARTNHEQTQRESFISYTNRRKQNQSTRRVIKMLVAVVIAFFLCWAPFHAQRLVAIYGTNENHGPRSPIFLAAYNFLTYTSGVFYYFSTCINPFFYHIMSNKFRDAFKDSIKRWCGSPRHDAGASVMRCSYTRVNIPRIPTPRSNGSGNTQHNVQLRMQNESSEPGVHVGSNSVAFITPQVSKSYIFKRRFANRKKTPRAEDIMLNVLNDRRCTSECGANETTPIDAITVFSEPAELGNRN